MNKLVVVAAGMLYRDGKLLITQRPAGGHGWPVGIAWRQM